MIIIWGLKASSRLLGILTVACRLCGNPAAQRLEEVRRTFTLFWLPLFPVSRRTYLTCTFCGTRSRVAPEQVDGLLQYAVTPGGSPFPVPPAHGRAPLP